MPFVQKHMKKVIHWYDYIDKVGISLAEVETNSDGIPIVVVALIQAMRKTQCSKFFTHQ